MNSKQKEILQTHRSFLVKNIVWTDNLASLFKTQGLLTDSMLADIEAVSNREEKLKLLMDLLPLRGNQAFEKLCDVLHVSGHQFLSDFLREEENNNETLDVKELMKRLPFLGRGLKDIEKKQVEAYITEKIQSEHLKYVWKRDSKEKEKWLEAKQKQLEDAFLFEEERKQKNDKIVGLERSVKYFQEDNIELKAKLKRMKESVGQMQEKHKEAMGVQMRFNVANDSAIQRTNEKVQQMEYILKTIHRKLNDIVRLQPRHNEKDQMALSKNEFTFVLEDFEMFVSKFNQLLHVQQKYSDLLEERNWILIHLGFSPEAQNAPSLLLAYKDFAVRNDENIQSLREEIAKYGGMLEDNKTKIENLAKEKEDLSKKTVETSQEEEEKVRKFASGAAVWQAAIMTVMRKQLHDLKTDNRKKESRISIQDEEIGKLKTRIRDMEKEMRQTRLAEKEKEKVQKDKENQGDSPDLVNGLVSASTDSLEVRSERTRKSNPLPPLRFGQYSKQNQPPSPRPIPVRRLQASMPRNFGTETQQLDSFPEGLTLSPVKLENRSKNQMGNGLGDLKTIHNRHRGSMTFVEKGKVTSESRISPSLQRKDSKVK